MILSDGKTGTNSKHTSHLLAFCTEIPHIESIPASQWRTITMRFYSTSRNDIETSLPASNEKLSFNSTKQHIDFFNNQLSKGHRGLLGDLSFLDSLLFFTEPCLKPRWIIKLICVRHLQRTRIKGWRASAQPTSFISQRGDGSDIIEEFLWAECGIYPWWVKEWRKLERWGGGHVDNFC